MKKRVVYIAILIVALWFAPILESGALAAFPSINILLFPVLIVVALMISQDFKINIYALGGAAWRDIYLFFPPALSIVATLFCLLSFYGMQKMLSRRSFWSDATLFFFPTVVFIVIVEIYVQSLKYLQISWPYNLPNIFNIGSLIFFASLVLAALLRRQAMRRQYLT